MIHVLSPGTPSGPSAAFVHGIEDSWRVWTRLARCLGPRWRAVALDVPWRAGSDYRWRWSGSPADWIASGLDTLEDRPTVLVGHSFGANAILSLLATAPAPRTAAAVLLAPFYRPPEAPVTWKTFELSRETFERQISDGMQARTGDRAMDVFDLMLARTLDRIGPTGFLAVFEQYVASGHLPLSRVDAPARILVGEGDPAMHRPHMDALGARLSNGKVVYGPDYDHFCHIQRAPEVAQIIEEVS